MGLIKFKQNKDISAKYEDRKEELKNKEENSSKEKIVLSNKDEEKPTILYEDKNRREANVKHYKMSDGSYQAQIFNKPIHYYSETEKRYVSIDNTLCESTACKENDFDGYENKRGDIRVKFGKRSKDEKIFVLQKGEYRVECSLLGDASKDSSAIKNSNAVLPRKSEAGEVKLSDEIRYNEVLPNTDLQYILTLYKIKENIIVKECREKYEYNFSLKLKNLNVELSENGRQLNLFTNKTDKETKISNKEVIFTIPMPYMYDADKNTSHDVDCELEFEGNDSYIFRIKANSAWINAEERKFPVTIDPMILLPSTQYVSLKAMSETSMINDNHNYGVCGYVNDQKYYVTFIDINLPSAILDTKISSVLLPIYVSYTECSDNQPKRFYVRRLTSNCSGEHTWDDLNNLGDIIEILPQKLGKIELDLTKLVTSGQNFGAVLVPANMSSNNKDDYYLEFVSDTAEEFRLVVNYSDEHCMVSDKQQINTVKRAGTHLVDLWTGKNRFIHSDNEFDENKRLSLSISHIYNFKDRGNMYISASNDLHTTLLGVGKGWKLNVQQFLYPVSVVTEKYTESTGYLYIDQNGDEIIFKPVEKHEAVYDSSGNVAALNKVTEYWDDQGKKLKCGPYGDELRIEDNEGTILSFRNNELYKITDKNADTITIVRDACEGKISRVSDSLGHYATFYYDTACRINRISFSDGKSLLYAYDANSRLIKITYTDLTSTEFYYGQSWDFNSLTSVRDQSGYRLSIEYTDAKVTSLQDFASNKKISSAGAEAYVSGESGVASYQTYNGTVYENKGKKIVIKYTNNRTSVITENKFGENYQFSATGFCECEYVTKNELNASENKKYVTEITSFKSYDAFDINEIRPNSFANNYITNGNFEGLSNCSCWISSSDQEFNTFYGISVNGDYSLRILGDPYGKKMLYQTIRASDLSLQEGEALILSGYAKADSIPITDSVQFGIRVDLIYRNNPKETITANFDYKITGWQHTAKGFIVENFSDLLFVNVYIDYSYNNGTAYFDDIRLMKGDAVFTRGLPRFYTNSDSKTYDINELVGISYYDNDHIFGWRANEQIDVRNAKISYMDIIAMQQNPGMAIINGEVEDTGIEPKSIMLIFEKDNVQKRYSLFDVEYAASGMTEIINGSGKVRIYKNKHDDVEKTVIFNNVSDTDEKFCIVNEFDSQNRLTKQTDFRGIVKEYTYTNSTKYNNVTATKINGKIIHSQVYNNNSYVEKTYDERRYDEYGNDIKTVTNYSMTKDRLESIELPNGQTITYSYDTTNTYMLGISANISSRRTPSSSLQTQNIRTNYAYNLGYLTSIDTGEGRMSYGYVYDGFGNLTKTLVNGVEVIEINRFKDSTYSSTNESTFNYEELVLSNGTKIKEITDNRGRLVCRKISKQTGENNGVKIYGPEQESYRVVYKADSNGETHAEIYYTIDKMPALDYSTPDDNTKWIYTYYHYKDSGELDYTSHSGYRSGYVKVTQNKGRTETEEYNFNNAYLNQTHDYVYETDSSGEIYPDNRVVQLKFKRNKSDSTPYETLKYNYDELGRVTHRYLIGQNTSGNYFRDIYSYKARNARNSCNCVYQEGTTNYLSSIQYRCGSVSGTEFVDYDKNGNIIKIQDGLKVTTYSYDSLNRLIGEENGFIGKNYFYSYDADGNLKEVYTKANTSEAWEKREVYNYSSTNVNQLISITEYDLTNNTSQVKSIASSYDGMGNPQSYRGQPLSWKRGRVLFAYGTTQYKYDGNNIRTEKIIGNEKHDYYTVGGQILGEVVTSRSEVNRYRYVYEGEKIIALIKNNSEYYYYQYGVSGNIERICNADGSIAAKYAYDAWGNCRIYTSSGLDITENSDYNNHIGRINPFRYKSYYFDIDTGYYYLQSRYYDPQTRRFINADNVGVITDDYLTTLGGQNLYSYCLNNPVNSYDPTGHSVVAVISLLIALIALGFAIYGLVEAAIAFYKEPSWLNLLFLVVAVVDVVMSVIAVCQAFTALMTAIKDVGAKKVLMDSAKQANGQPKSGTQPGTSVQGDCFIAGTQVKTEEGYKNIEDIKVGDRVLAYDEKTGKQAYKEVVRLFRGETDEWYHIHTNGEEIVCTGNHPFYVQGKGFVKAKELTLKDKLTLSDGTQVSIENIEVEKLETPETKYNFEVEDFHTYYVTDSDVLVHNKCAQGYLDEALKRQGLDKVPEGGFKETWIEGNYKIEVRVHAGNPKYTNANQILRVSRRPVGMGKSMIEYLGSDKIWYSIKKLKPNSFLFDPVAAMVTHIPI